MIFDIKMDNITWKARLVAGGHTTETIPMATKNKNQQIVISNQNQITPTLGLMALWGRCSEWLYYPTLSKRQFSTQKHLGTQGK